MGSRISFLRRRQAMATINVSGYRLFNGVLFKDGVQTTGYHAPENTDGGTVANTGSTLYLNGVKLSDSTRRAPSIPSSQTYVGTESISGGQYLYLGGNRDTGGNYREHYSILYNDGIKTTGYHAPNSVSGGSISNTGSTLYLNGTRVTTSTRIAPPMPSNDNYAGTTATTGGDRLYLGSSLDTGGNYRSFGNILYNDGIKTTGYHAPNSVSGGTVSNTGNTLYFNGAILTDSKYRAPTIPSSQTYIGTTSTTEGDRLYLGSTKVTTGYFSKQGINYLLGNKYTGTGLLLTADTVGTNSYSFTKYAGVNSYRVYYHAQGGGGGGGSGANRTSLWAHNQRADGGNGGNSWGAGYSGGRQGEPQTALGSSYPGSGGRGGDGYDVSAGGYVAYGGAGGEGGSGLDGAPLGWDGNSGKNGSTGFAGWKTFNPSSPITVTIGSNLSGTSTGFTASGGVGGEGGARGVVMPTSANNGEAGSNGEDADNNAFLQIYLPTPTAV